MCIEISNDDRVILGLEELLKVFRVGKVRSDVEYICMDSNKFNRGGNSAVINSRVAKGKMINVQIDIE